jgi:hypothetical protein
MSGELLPGDAETDTDGLLGAAGLNPAEVTRLRAEGVVA